VLEHAAGLSPRALEAIADLERQVVAVDGGRLKLEWGQLRRRTGERVEDLLWWEGDRLLGFLGLYAFGSWLELAGMVAPDARRRGIGTALLEAAVPLYAAGRYRQVLLIVPRASLAGRGLAERHGGALDHSEHALVLSGPLTPAGQRSELSLRPATPADIPLVARLLEEGFGHPAPDVAHWLTLPRERTLVVVFEGSAVGTLRLISDGDGAGVYGFVVDPAWQGRGIGREALRRACDLLRSEGTRDIRLEVAVENDRALALYTSLGFVPVTTEDYYVMPAAGTA
jgi:ribosomal protein S18 acetylase RimI-like enzyme